MMKRALSSIAVPTLYWQIDPAEENTSNSFCALFRLGSLGYIRLLRDKETFNLRELRQLRTLIDKFYIALKGALAYERLNTELIFLTSLIIL